MYCLMLRTVEHPSTSRSPPSIDCFKLDSTTLYSTFSSKPPHDPACHLVSTAVSHGYLQTDILSVRR
ncbi:hypothetical protein HDV63DRAFT_373591 [Trichoderma sp. SZMC 28014]